VIESQERAQAVGVPVPVAGAPGIPTVPPTHPQDAPPVA
jgi:hypothetical protein